MATDNQGKDAAPFPESTAALQAIRILVCIALTTCGILFVSDLWGFFYSPGWLAKRKASVVDRQGFWLRVILFANVFFTILTLSVLAVAIFLVPFNLDPSACDAIMKTALFGYTFSFQAVLLFFAFRVSFIGDLLQSDRYRLISNMTKAALIILIPAYNIPNAMLLFEGLVTKDGVCVLNVTAIWAPLVFIGLAFVLTFIMLYLFISPLQASLAALNPVSALRLKRVMARNIALSFISLCATIISLTTFTWLNFRSPEPNYNQILGMLSPAMELFVILVCSRLMILEESQIAAFKVSCLRLCRCDIYGDRPSSKILDNDRVQMETRPLPSSSPPVFNGLMVV